MTGPPVREVESYLDHLASVGVKIHRIGVTPWPRFSGTTHCAEADERTAMHRAALVRGADVHRALAEFRRLATDRGVVFGSFIHDEVEVHVPWPSCVERSPHTTQRKEVMEIRAGDLYDYLDGRGQGAVTRVSLFRICDGSRGYLHAYHGPVSADEIWERFGEGSFVLKVYRRGVHGGRPEEVRVVLGPRDGEVDADVEHPSIESASRRPRYRIRASDVAPGMFVCVGSSAREVCGTRREKRSVSLSMRGDYAWIHDVDDFLLVTLPADSPRKTHCTCAWEIAGVVDPARGIPADHFGDCPVAPTHKHNGMRLWPVSAEGGLWRCDGARWVYETRATSMSLDWDGSLSALDDGARDLVLRSFYYPPEVPDAQAEQDRRVGWDPESVGY